MITIAIHGRPFKKESRPLVQNIFRSLKKRGTHTYISQNFYDFFKKKNIEIELDNPIVFSDKKEIKDVDLLLSIGGDGTLIETVSYGTTYGIPVLGLNLGRLGFLATVNYEDFDQCLDLIYQQNYSIEERALIELNSPEAKIDGSSFALNEFTITKKDSANMIVVHTYVNDKFLNSYWADGIIVSTPTGSTGYSLSCGGPIVTPDSNIFIVSPICPHNLNVRPLVIPDNSVIKFEIEGRLRNFLISLDSRSKSVTTTTDLSIKKASEVAKLISLEHHFFDTLRNKLSWGLDKRN